MRTLTTMKSEGSQSKIKPFQNHSKTKPFQNQTNQLAFHVKYSLVCSVGVSIQKFKMNGIKVMSYSNQHDVIPTSKQCLNQWHFWHVLNDFPFKQSRIRPDRHQKRVHARFFAPFNMNIFFYSNKINSTQVGIALLNTNAYFH